MIIDESAPNFMVAFKDRRDGPNVICAIGLETYDFGDKELRIEPDGRVTLQTREEWAAELDPESRRMMEEALRKLANRNLTSKLSPRIIRRL